MVSSLLGFPWSRCILGIETSFRMQLWHWFLGQRLERKDEKAQNRSEMSSWVETIKNKWLPFIWGSDFHCACQFSVIAHWAMSNVNNCGFPVVTTKNFCCKQNNYSGRKLNKTCFARTWAWKYNETLQYAKTAILFIYFLGI